MLKKFAISILFFATALGFSFGVQPKAQAYTKPGNPSGFVNDFAGILDADQKSELESKLSQYEKDTSNEIAVAIVKDLGGDTIENYAVKLFEDWKIGKEKNDNGALLLVAINDREMRIEVGYGLEPYLTDAESSQIINKVIKPEFQNGNYYSGISTGLGSMVQAIGQTDYKVNGSSSGSGEFPVGALIWVGLFVIGTLIRILSRSKSWWQGGMLGAGAGVLIGLFTHFLYTGVVSIFVLGGLGLLLDYFVSKNPPGGPGSGRSGGLPWWIGNSRGFGGSGSGGFGGFGGGSSGGGGASGKW